MSFDWNNYLELAKTLSVAVADEASLRSAVSRAYYCAFNLAMARAAANSYRSPDDGSSHDLLWALYGRNNDAACKQLALVGPRMKRRRVKADYRADYHRLAEEVKDAIADAEQCAALIASLPKGLPVDLPRTFSFR
jgi:uncharacterized protein (UPF0332 family)